MRNMTKMILLTTALVFSSTVAYAGSAMIHVKNECGLGTGLMNARVYLQKDGVDLVAAGSYYRLPKGHIATIDGLPDGHTYKVNWTPSYIVDASPSKWSNNIKNGSTATCK